MSTVGEELTALERFTPLAELTAEELITRGEQLIKLGQRLAAVGMGIMPTDTALTDGSARSVGRLGVVNEATAIQVAKTLGEFDRPAFAEALGLRGGATSKWLSLLINHRPPIIERREDGTYAYLEPPVTRAPERRPAPETQLVTESPARGQPIPVDPMTRAKKVNPSILSTGGQGHHVRQAQKRFEQANPKEAGKAGRRRARQRADARRRNGSGP